MKKIIPIIVSFCLVLSSCDVVQQILDDNTSGQGLTESEIISGLKKALTTGTESSTSTLNKRDGFFKDKAIKIMLPPEADVIVKNIRKIPGIGDKTVNDVILRINRSAEDAAITAKPIFFDAIKTMTIHDGINILKGKSQNSSSFDSTAATSYLRSKTYQKLVNAFAPKINTSLDKKIVGNISTNKAWGDMVNIYNKAAPFLRKPKINPDLGAFVTEKALDGLFKKIALEEKKIRKNPKNYVSDIIKKVFGYVFK